MRETSPVYYNIYSTNRFTYHLSTSNLNSIKKSKYPAVNSVLSVSRQRAIYCLL